MPRISHVALACLMCACAEQQVAQAPPIKLQEDRKNHGPLDGHAVMVLELIEKMELDRDTTDRCARAAQKSQNEYRKWYGENREKILEYNNTIRKLKAEDNNAELRKILPQKKKFMHTAPSILRYPEPLKDILEKDYPEFHKRLDALRVSLHKPRKKPQP